MNAFLSFFKYILIIILVAAGILLLALGALVLFPSFKIFGLHYITGDSTQDLITIPMTGEGSENFVDADVLRFETTTFDVTVKTLTESQLYNSENITVEFYHKLTGFVYGDVEFPTVQGTEFFTENGKNVLLVKVLEPEGWIFKSNAVLVINCTEDALRNKDVEIITSSGLVNVGDTYRTSIDEETEEVKIDSSITQLNNLTITSGSGEVNIRSCEINGELSVTKSSGNLNVSRDLMNDTYVSITDGLGKIYLQNIGSETKSASLIMRDVANSDIQLGSVYGDMILVANGGLLRMDYVQDELSVDSNSCEVRVTTVGEMLMVEGADGRVAVTNVQGDVMIKQGAGNVEIGSIDGTANIETTRGDVTLNSVFSDSSVTTTFGAINIYCGAQCDLVVRSQSGRVNIDNMSGTLDFRVLENGSSNVTVNFTEVNGVNSIITESGSINVNLSSAVANYYFVEWSTARNANIQLYSYQSTDKVGGVGTRGDDNDKNNYTSQILLTSTVGNITVQRLVNN